MERGLNAMNMLAIWVNADGHRFANELLSSKLLLPEVLRQPGGTYWAIFDEPAKKAFQIAGTDWIEFATIDRLIFGNEKIVQSGPTIAVLARTTGLPEKALIESVQRYNRLLDAGDDTDFSRFGPSAQRFAGLAITPLMPPSRIEQPPFYAVQFFPMSRKNNGGIKVDLSCRVLSPQGEPIPGLLAVGEVTGSGGMNGTAGLEGVWLGPGVLMGRVAGKTVLDELRNRTTPRPPTKHLPQSLRIVSETKSCTDCHKITELVAQSRPGYWHFEFVHRTVQQRNQNCLECHSDLLPNPAAPHRMNPLVQAAACVSCHGAK